MALKRAVLLYIFLNLIHISMLWMDHQRHFSFRHSFANVLQYFNLSSKSFAEGSANISFVVETSPVLVNCCFSHDFNCFFISLSAREILVSITADKLEYCWRKKQSPGKSFTRFLALSNCLTSSVAPKIRSSARPCFVRQTSRLELLVQASGDISVKQRKSRI